MQSICWSKRKDPNDFKWQGQDTSTDQWRNFDHHFNYDGAYPYRPSIWLPEGYEWRQGRDGRFRRSRVGMNEMHVHRGKHGGERRSKQLPQQNNTVAGVNNNNNNNNNDDESSSESSSSESSSSESSSNENRAKKAEEEPRRAKSSTWPAEQRRLAMDYNAADVQAQEAAMLRNLHAEMSFKDFAVDDNKNSLKSGQLLLAGERAPVAPAVAPSKSEMLIVKCNFCDLQMRKFAGGSKKMTIADFAVSQESSAEFSQVVAALKRANLVDMFTKPAGVGKKKCFTVFLPVNSARTVQLLGAEVDLQRVTQALKNHVFVGCLHEQKLVHGGVHQLTMAGGAVFKVHVSRSRTSDAKQVKIGDSLLLGQSAEKSSGGGGLERVFENGSVYVLTVPLEEEGTGNEDMQPGAIQQSYANWEKQQLSAASAFICGNASEKFSGDVKTKAASAAASATVSPAVKKSVAATPESAVKPDEQLKFSAEEVLAMADEFDNKPLVNEKMLREQVKNAVSSGAPVQIEFEHTYISNPAGVQIIGAIEPSHVQHVHVSLKGQTHTLKSGGKAYYFDLAVAPSSVAHGPNDELRVVAKRAVKIEFDKSKSQYKPQLVGKQLDELTANGVHEVALEKTQAQLNKLICGALFAE